MNAVYIVIVDRNRLFFNYFLLALLAHLFVSLYILNNNYYICTDAYVYMCMCTCTHMCVCMCIVISSRGVNRCKFTPHAANITPLRP